MAERKPKAATGEAWGIINPFGDVWTYDTLKTPEAAEEYVRWFWAGTKDGPALDTFKPVRVRVRVTVAPAPKEDPK